MDEGVCAKVERKTGDSESQFVYTGSNPVEEENRR